MWNSYYVDKVPHADNLRGSFWWKDIMKLFDNFRAISFVGQGTGDSFMFWNDNWQIDNSITTMKAKFLGLCSFAINDELSAAAVFDMVDDLPSLFHPPSSCQAVRELEALKAWMLQNPLSLDHDVWSFCWGKNYTAKQFYLQAFKHLTVPKSFSWIWESRCTMNYKVFAWLLLRDRLNMKDMLKRRHWNVAQDDFCVLCPLRAYEDRQHLFFTCNFSQRVWNYLQIQWIVNDNIQVVLAHARRSFGHVFAMEVIMVACRHIWLQRNSKVFRNERPTFSRWKNGFVHDMTLIRFRLKAKHVSSFLTWLDGLP